MNTQPSNSSGTSPESHGDLFAPSLQHYNTNATNPKHKPWRLWSQVWIAFFGGPLPYALIAYLNSRRLSLPQNRQRLVAMLGVIGFVGAVVISYAIATTNYYGEGRIGSQIRLATRIAGISVFAIGYRLQNSADRRYEFSGDGAYESLWKPGLAATLGLGALQNLLIWLLLASFQ